MFKYLASFIVAFVMFSGAPLVAQDNKRPLMLTGRGEVKMAPDMAIVDFGVESQGSTAKAALEANTRNMAALLATLKAAAVDDKDIQTNNFSVQPRYDDKPNVNPPKIVGYAVNNAVSVAVRKLDNLGALLDKAVAAGSNQINNVGFTVSDPNAARDTARKAAVKDATSKATVLADAAGVKLGALQSMSEQGGGQVIPMAKMSRMAQAPMDAQAVPISEGQVSITADVNMVWEMQ